MTRDSDHCTFCNLIHGAAEVSVCHEDADSIAFMDIQPVNNGHVLVVPRDHYQTLAEIPNDLAVHLFRGHEEWCADHLTGLGNLEILIHDAD